MAALVPGEVLRPLDMAIKTRVRKRFSKAAVDTSDDGARGETHPMGSIDDVGVATPHVDVHSSLRNFNRLGRPFRLYLNPSKTMILI